MSENQKNNRSSIAHHIFSGSTTMIGVCITVITLFSVMRTGAKTYADEMLSVDTLLFIAASLFSFMSLRNNNNRRFEALADICFFLGMFVMIGVGIIIVSINL